MPKPVQPKNAPPSPSRRHADDEYAHRLGDGYALGPAEGFSLDGPTQSVEPTMAYGLTVGMQDTAPPSEITKPMPRPEDAPGGELTVTEKDEERDKEALAAAFYRAKQRDAERIDGIMAVDFYCCVVFNCPEDAERFAKECGVPLDDESCIDGYALARKLKISSVPSIPLPYPKVSTPEKWRKLALKALGPPPEWTNGWSGKGKMPPFPLMVKPDDLRVLQLHRENGEPLPPHLVMPTDAPPTLKPRATPKRKGKTK